MSYVSALLAAALLVVVLLGVVTMARYNALVGEARQACGAAAAPLDLSSWVPLCKSVGT